MTEQEIIDYYANLLIIQYRGKYKAVETIRALVSMVIAQLLPFAVRDGFSVDTAIGAQLDIIGKFVGISRVVLTFSGQATLNDDDYRTLIKMKIIQNKSDGTLYSIQQLVNTFFSGKMVVFDHTNMEMSYYLSTDLGSTDLAEAFVRQALLPRPMGVQMSALIYAPSVVNMFGMADYDSSDILAHGFNTYEQFDDNCHWLDYTDVVSN